MSAPSAKLAGIREWWASQPESAPPSRTSPRVFNTPKRAAKGQVVPPPKKADAPRLFQKFVEPCLLRIVEMRRIAGPTTYVIVDSEGVTFDVEAETMTDLLPWLTRYAEEIDRARDGGK